MARPNLSYLKNLLLALTGLPCGAVTGLTGLGNSVILLPLLRWLIALKGQALSGTTLAIMFFSALTSLLAYGQDHDVLWAIGGCLIAGYLPGAIVGGKLAPAPPRTLFLRPLWCLLTLALGFFMVLHSFHIGPGAKIGLDGLRRVSDAERYGLTFAVGLVVGVVSRVADLGGTLMVPALIYLLHEPPREAQGTALFVLLIAAFPGALRYAAVRQLDSRAAVWVSFGAILGALIGSQAASTLSAETLLFLYGLALIAIGLGMAMASERKDQHDS